MTTPPNRRFAGRAYLVTGAGRGLGQSIARRIAEEGGAVAVNDLKLDDLADTLAAVRELGGTAVAIAGDVTDADAVEAMVATAVRELGPLAGAVNNAGRSCPQVPFAEFDDATWDAVMDLNVRGVFLCCKHEIAQMSGNGGGAIVNIASMVGIRTPITGIGPYTTSKHAVIGLTKSAARDHAAAGIRVNAVCPGQMRTPMLDEYLGSHPDRERASLATIPMRRIASPDEIAAAVAFLLSDDASYVTGHALAVDGGSSL